MNIKPQGANQTELTTADGTLILYSYQTPVACWKDGAFYRTEISHSRTTQKHITQFMRRHGAYTVTSKPQAFFDNLTRSGK